MVLIAYISRKSGGISIAPSEYNEEFVVVASINSFVNCLEMIDNLILNELANRKLAPYGLSKKCAKNERIKEGQSKSQLNSKHFIVFMRGQTPKLDQNYDLNHSLITQSANQLEIKTNNTNSSRYKYISKKLGRQNMKDCEGVFIPEEQDGDSINSGTILDELSKDAYILVAVDKWSNISTAKVVSNTTADLAIKFMQRYISNNGVLRRLRCDQAQSYRAKKLQMFCKSNSIKFLFAPVDDQRSIGVVERLIQTLKRRLRVMKIDPNNSPFKIASCVVDIIPCGGRPKKLTFWVATYYQKLE